MTKFLTILTSAILALLLIAIGFYLVRDRTAPRSAVVSLAADPAYEAAIAPPEFLVSTPARSIGGTSGSERPCVVVSSGDDAGQSGDDSSGPAVVVSQTHGAGMDAAELPSSSADHATGQEEADEMVQETTPEPVEPLPDTAVLPDTPIASENGDRATASRDVSDAPVDVGSMSPGAGRIANLDAADPDAEAQDSALDDDGDGARQPADQALHTYTVRRGDTLSSIARRYYGDPALWEHIRDANRAVLGKGARQIPVGKQLTIPPLEAR